MEKTNITSKVILLLVKIVEINIVKNIIKKILTISTKEKVIIITTQKKAKNIERNIVQQNEEILSRKDIEVSKLIIETFKIPTFEVDMNIKNINNNQIDGIDKYKGKLNDIKNLFNKK